jgi:hypothetical protein
MKRAGGVPAARFAPLARTIIGEGRRFKLRVSTDGQPIVDREA